MSETQCWLVEREYGQKNLVTLVYATPDGGRKLTSQRTTTMLMNESVTAATDVRDEDLESVRDPDERERYRREAERMAARHDPDDTV